MAPKKRHKRRKRTVSLAAATPRAHSLLDRYGPTKKRARKEEPRVQPIVIDDPYAAEFPAVLREAPRSGDASITAQQKSGIKQGSAAASHEWIAPPKRPIEVLASSRDGLAGMFARRFIDKAMFLAGRDYQSVYELAAALRIKTVDPSMPPISGGSGGEAIDAVAAAADRLKRIEARLAKSYGAEAVQFVREVLGDGLTVERAAVRRGEGDRPRVEWWGGLLRRCLRELAEASGFAVRGAYRNRAREAERLERERRREEKREREAAKAKRRKGKGDPSSGAVRDKEKAP